MSFTLTVGGQNETRWVSARVTRGLKRGCSDFELETPAEVTPPIVPFQACTLLENGDPVLTGYIVRCRPRVGARQSRTQIVGKSKTTDLVDCMPEFATNQFNGNTLDAIARAVCAPFGIGVVIGDAVDVGDPFPDATFERSEKGFAFLERLARQRGLLLTDDEMGNLVIATLGTAMAPAPLVMGPGGDVFEAEGDLNGEDRFSKYVIRSQAGKKATGGAVQNAVKAIAYDGGVPRYRPWAAVAESALLTGDAQIRANWEAAHRSGQAVSAKLSVPEFRAGGSLWQINQLVDCAVPRLSLSGQFLIGQVDMTDDEHAGRMTKLSIAPPSAFTPDPEEKLKAKKSPKGGAGGGGGPWTGLVNVTGNGP